MWNLLCSAALASSACFCALAMLAHFGNAKEPSGSGQRLQHSLLISEASDDLSDFKNDSALEIGGGNAGGQIVAYVNDSPVRVHVFGGAAFNIDDLVVPGKNEVRLEGKHTSRLYAKVLVLDRANMDVKEVLAKALLPPDQVAATITFEARAVEDRKYELLPEDPCSRKRLRKEILGWVTELNRAWDREDAEKIFELMSPDLKSRPRTWVDRNTARRDSVPKLVKATRDYEWVTPLRDIRMLFGKRTVLVYSGVTELGMTTHLFEAKNKKTGERDLHHPAVVLVRLDGKWTAARP